MKSESPPTEDSQTNLRDDDTGHEGLFSGERGGFQRPHALLVPNFDDMPSATHDLNTSSSDRGTLDMTL